MSGQSIFIAGLPDSGKTTFLAALWHLVFSGEIETELGYESIRGLRLEYLNKIRRLWLEAKPIGRTRSGEEQTAALNLKHPDGRALQLTLPDFAGEGFRRMWERRTAPGSIVEAARHAEGHLILVNAGLIAYPRTVDELRAELAALGEKVGPELPFNPRKCPTAVMLVDVMSSILGPAIGANPRKVAIALTAWDEVDEDGLTPEELLTERLPILRQYINSHASDREFRVFGVSAQGASYDGGRDAALDHEVPTDRILLVDGSERSHDLTRMLAWLLD